MIYVIVPVHRGICRVMGIGDEAYTLVNCAVAFHGKAQELIDSENFKNIALEFANNRSIANGKNPNSLGYF